MVKNLLAECQKQCVAKLQVVYHTLYLTSLAGFIAKLQILREPLGAVQRTEGLARAMV
jgi:hypothetical protein